MGKEGPDLLQGTLDMLVLQALTAGPKHGYAVAHWIEDRTTDVLSIEEGSLYPALYRMEKKGWIASRWGKSENNRRARFYDLTDSGRHHLESEAAGFERFIEAVRKVMQPA